MEVDFFSENGYDTCHNSFSGYSPNSPLLKIKIKTRRLAFFKK